MEYDFEDEYEDQYDEDLSDEQYEEYGDGIDRTERHGFSVFMAKQWSTFFGPEWEGSGPKFTRGMFGKNGQLLKMGSFLAKGCGIRETQRIVGGSRNTVIKLHRQLVAITGKEFLCECGKPSTHQGWCKPRFVRSDARQMFMRMWQEKRKIASLGTNK